MKYKVLLLAMVLTLSVSAVYAPSYNDCSIYGNCQTTSGGTTINSGNSTNFTNYWTTNTNQYSLTGTKNMTSGDLNINSGSLRVYKPSGNVFSAAGTFIIDNSSDSDGLDFINLQANTSGYSLMGIYQDDSGDAILYTTENVTGNAGQVGVYVSPNNIIYLLNSYGGYGNSDTHVKIGQDLTNVDTTMALDLKGNMSATGNIYATNLCYGNGTNSSGSNCQTVSSSWVGNATSNLNMMQYNITNTTEYQLRTNYSGLEYAINTSSTNYVTVPSSSSLTSMSTTKRYGVSGWFYRQTGSGDFLFSIATSGIQCFSNSGNGNIFCNQFGDNFCQPNVASGNLTLNAWTHFVITNDGTNIYMYVNGVLKSTLACAGGTGGGALVIGEASYGGTMGIDNLAFFNKSLSGTDVTNLYNSGAGLFINTSVSPYNTGLMAGYNFDEGQANKISDSSGRNNGGTGISTGLNWVTGKVANPSLVGEQTGHLTLNNNLYTFDKNIKAPNVCTTGEGGCSTLFAHTDRSQNLTGTQTMVDSVSHGTPLTMTSNGAYDWSMQSTFPGNIWTLDFGQYYPTLQEPNDNPAYPFGIKTASAGSYMNFLVTNTKNYINDAYNQPLALTFGALSGTYYTPLLLTNSSATISNVTINGILNVTGDIYAHDNGFYFNTTTNNLNVSGNVTARYKSSDGTIGVTASGTTCTITAIKDGIITAAVCV